MTFQTIYMTFAINMVDVHGLSNKVSCEHLQNETKLMLQSILAIYFIGGGVLTIFYQQQG